MEVLVGGGGGEGGMDAGNILEAALARGKIQVIGATTTDEYTKHIEKDAALERRFQPIQVPETTVPETLAILKGLRKHYEKFHGVTISDEVLEHTVNLAKRYINDRFMPDKAIDLLDETAAHLRVDRGKTDAQPRENSRQIRDWPAGSGGGRGACGAPQPFGHWQREAAGWLVHFLRTNGSR